MDSRYIHQDHESKISQLWEQADVANPDRAIGSTGISDDLNNTTHPSSTKQSSKRAKDKLPKSARLTKKKSFCIILPPPNANDPLHVGHAMYAVEDVFVRYHRMLGDDTLWLPGTDHAGIETQFVFEKKLQLQGKSRFDFDRASLYHQIWEYVQANSDTAKNQLQTLGFSLDWSRFKFTLNPEVVEFVRNTFYQLHKDKLIYRDLQLVNYCTKCGTSYSDLEVVYKTQTTPLYYIKYGPLEVATVRPETTFGDVALAVHPADPRYQHYIGATVAVTNVLGTTRLPVIADEFVDPKFGTGVVKITPAHDFNDFAVGQKHHLLLKQAINTRGKLTEIAGEWAGQNAVQARLAVVERLQELGLVSRIDESYTTNISVCYRCGRPIEPLPLPQFFVKVNDPHHSLTSAALADLDTKRTIVHGAGREKILHHWLENLHDWNISRQIVWGIRIPVWYCCDGHEGELTISFVDAQGKIQWGQLSEMLKLATFAQIIKGLQTVSANITVPYVVGESQPTEKGTWIPETDTLDTWFSSSQWPVVTLKTSQPTDFERFYPTAIMETAYDILVFWVMRMMLMGEYLTGQSPFKDVYLHGLIRDNRGQKMSKSKGNVVNPLSVVERYGADALRLALIIRSTPGQDKSVGEPDFMAARNFTNKLWNAARFVIAQQQSKEGVVIIGATVSKSANTDDRLNAIIEETTTALNRLKPGLALDRLHDALWHWYCDEVIEDYKHGLVNLDTLTRGIATITTLLHPFIPFITEAIWQELRAAQLVSVELVALSSWPTQTPTLPEPKITPHLPTI